MSFPKPAVKTRPASFPTDKAIVSRLFLTYAESLPISLAFQNFPHELASLPGNYAVQNGGALDLAYTEAPKSDATPAPEQVVSCVCLCALAPCQSCELKHLYPAPEARGLGVGKLLLDVVVARARDLGYEEMLLGTLSSMGAARRLYAGYGFGEVGAYYESVPGAVFYRLDLRELGN